MAAPRFLQRTPPGTPVPGVGFIRPGSWFDAPEGFIPSKLGAHLPMNEEAQELFKKCHPKVECPPLVAVPQVQPTRGPAGLTLRELDDLERAKALDAGESSKERAQQAPPSKQAAQAPARKL